mmetsp:Transcript_58997/g.133596  ORF Transcript_58997/g.133596 Transcript_58997/m.133596 type:complete len:223 (+) Transcript_58997:323-991(+)
MGSPLGPRLMGRSEGGGAVMGRTLTRLRPPPDRPAPSSSSSKPPPPPGEPGLLAGVLPTPVPEASSGSLPEAHRKCRSGGSSPASCLFIDTSMDLSSLSEPSPSSSPWKRLYRRISRSSFLGGTTHERDRAPTNKKGEGGGGGPRSVVLALLTWSLSGSSPEPPEDVQGALELVVAAIQIHKVDATRQWVEVAEELVVGEVELHQLGKPRQRVQGTCEVVVL